MSIPHFCLVTAAKVAACSLAIGGAPLTAQVPENALVVGTAAQANTVPGTTGVFYVTLPTTSQPGGTITRLLRLPPELTVASGKFGGAWSVLRRPSDGTLFVGDGGINGQWVHVHILKMQGFVVSSFRSVRVGQVPNSGHQSRLVGGLAVLPDGRVLVAAGPFAVGPMAGSPVAILDDGPTTPTVTPVLVSAQLAGPFVYGATVSRDGRTAYVISQRSANQGIAPALLYEIDITTPKQPVAPILLHTWPKYVVPKLTRDHKGVLYATGVDPNSKNPPAPTIEEIRVLANKTVQVTSTPVGEHVDVGPPVSGKVAVVGPALEPASGRFVFVSAVLPTLGTNALSVLIGDRNGTLKLLTGPPAGGWGMPFAIDINPAFETYGAGTKAANSYAFVESPNPGGLPEVGNSKFSMTVEWAGSKTIPSVMILGAKDIDVVVLGVRLLVQPDFLLPMTAQPGKATLPLPIPNDVALRGLPPLFAQSLHLEPAFATSNGVRVDIQ